MRLFRKLTSLLTRRGPRYLGYLLYGVAWPKFAYRFGWGPSAPRMVRAVFYASLVASTAMPDFIDDPQFEWLMASGDEPGRAATADEVEKLMDKAHRAGITGVRSGFATAIRLRDGSVRFTKLPAARRHRWRGTLFAADRDRDRVAFNERFKADILTEANARGLLHERRATVPSGYRDYAPIDFNGGITVGRIVSTDSGTGRWDFFNRHVVAPLVAGRRVLDLGSNNGSLPLMMLRAGARSVVGIEAAPQLAEFARLNARILAWRDMRAYDIRIVTGDMRLFVTEDLGRFDVVTAFCSLYYLSEDDMRRVIQKAAAMRADLVLQSNEAIDNLPAHAADLRFLMMENGYPTVDTHEVRGYARTLLVGHPAAPAPLRFEPSRPSLMEV